MYQLHQKTIDLGNQNTITIETGKLAKQANGSVVVRQGKTMLLATVVAAKEAKENTDFMPLSVEYQEKFSAIGRFPGGFTRREGRPSDREILISRLVDRVLRPLFPDDYHAEVFVNIMLISAEQEIQPDTLAGLAASAALAVSDIPFNGPISEVRVARIDGKFVINPSFTENSKADIELIVGATYENIMMVEGEMAEVSEADMIEALKIAHEAIKIQCIAQKELTVMVGKTEKQTYQHETNDEELRKEILQTTYDKVMQTAKAQLPKQQRAEAFEKIKLDFIEEYKARKAQTETEFELNEILVGRYYHEVEKKAVRNLLLDEKIRLDGRKPEQIRPIWCEVDYLPTAHGSAIFTRGETQSLTSVTLGTKLNEKIIDDVLAQGTDKFLLHYNFPPFATGDAKNSRGVSRREIGHGNLAHRALKRMLPETLACPYTIRIVSEILESNGSSSMATVCAGTMALLDAGIKMKKPVSGIAMGLISDSETGRYVVLSDILGDEDHLGDMDFKVTGTEDGITACQMDIKVDGLSYEILAQALEQARRGRLEILKKLTDTISEARADYKPHVPRIVSITVPKEMIGAIIGPGGKIIQQMQEETGTQISIEEVDGFGIVDIAASNKASIDAALKRIKGIIAVPEIGDVYEGKVKSIVQFGAFVEILPGKEGLLHISEIAHHRLEKVEDALAVGDIIEVKLIDFDRKQGKLKLSRKALLPKPQQPSKPKQTL